LLAATAVVISGTHPGSAFAGASGAVPHRIAFIRHADLYTVRQDESGIRRLTETSEEEDHPAWSPGRRWLAFVARRRVVAIVQDDGDHRHPLVQVSDRFDGIDAVAWSPDGRRLAFSTRWVGDRAHLYRTCGYVWTIRRDGTRLHRILREQFPATGLAWTPNGRGLVSSLEPLNGTSPCRSKLLSGIVRFRADGANLRSLEAPFGTDPDVSPSGKRIVFRDWRRTCHACGEVFAARSDGSRQHVLIGLPAERIVGVGEPRFAPDGRHIAFVAQDRRGSFSLWVARADGSNAHHLLDRVDRLDW
jgi:Tol biopolymer transport system component